MKIQDILNAKGDAVVTVPPDAMALAAAHLLVQHGIGSVVVVEGAEIRGILTERDLLRAVSDDVQGIPSARVSDLMTTPVLTARADAEIRDVMNIMSDRRIRHLPVVTSDRLCGVISIGDVVNALRRDTEAENQQLHAYISGTPL